MDGVDVALIETDGEVIEGFGPTASYPYDALEWQLLVEAVESARGILRRTDRSGVLAIAEQAVTAKHAQCVKDFARAKGIDLSSVDVVGFHGQTVLHRPEKELTVQLGDGPGLSRQLGVPVVYDFRAADTERGGQGAPLAPIFHRALALRSKLPFPAAFVNIGGISNITFIPEGGPEAMIAFDVGPGNCLIDDWAMLHTGKPIDRDAKLALAGSIDMASLQAMLSNPYFSAPAPKSLDRHSFTLDPVMRLSPADGAATLTALTVAGIGASARLLPENPKIWIVSGGGARNPHILEGLRRILQPRLVTAEEQGFDSDFVEAQAFAFMAARLMRRLPSSFPGTTGAREQTVAGVLTNAGVSPETKDSPSETATSAE